ERPICIRESGPEDGRAVAGGLVHLPCDGSERQALITVHDVRVDRQRETRASALEPDEQVAILESIVRVGRVVAPDCQEVLALDHHVMGGERIRNPGGKLPCPAPVSDLLISVPEPPSGRQYSAAADVRVDNCLEMAPEEAGRPGAAVAVQDQD